jgi:hypothetical protein
LGVWVALCGSAGDLGRLAAFASEPLVGALRFQSHSGSVACVSRVSVVSAVVVPIPVVALLYARFFDGERRSRFWLRVVIVCLAMPTALATLIAVAALTRWPDDAAPGLSALTLLLFAALMFVESVLFRASDPPSAGGGDSGGDGPGDPPSAPERPSGELPLRDSDVGRWRVRDHGRPDLGDALPRRPAREPERALALD